MPSVWARQGFNLANIQLAGRIRGLGAGPRARGRSASL